MNITLRPVYCCIIGSVLFFTDTTAFFLVECPLLYLLLAWYFVAFSHNVGHNTQLFLAFLFVLESFIYYDTLGMPLLLLILATLSAHYAKVFLHQARLQAIGLYGLCLIAQVVGFEVLIRGAYCYTIGKIIANILMIIGFSLILHMQGSQGSRL